MRAYWESEIREPAEADWKKARDKVVNSALSGSKEYPTKKQAEGLKLQQNRATAKRLLALHTPEFLADLELAVEDDYQRQKEEYDKISKIPTTPHEYHECVSLRTVLIRTNTQS